MQNLIGTTFSIIRLIMLAAILALAGAADCAARAQTPILTAEQWRADLRILAEQLPRLHRNAFHAIAREDWEREVAALDAEIPSLPEHVIIVRLTRLVQLIGDVHTSLSWQTGVRPFQRYPIFFFNQADGLFVQAVPNAAQAAGRGRTDYQRAIGARLVQVGDYEIAEVKARLLPLVSADPGNPNWPNYYWPELLATPEFLHALGVTPEVDRALFVVEDASGVRFDLWLTALPRNQFNTNLHIWPGLRRWATPLVFSRSSSVFYWYEYLPAERAFYFRYRRCAEMAGAPWSAFAQEAFNAMLTNDVQRVVLDLRDNTGGNEALFNNGIDTIKQLPFNRRGSLFVLINNGTASSATSHANRLQMETQAIVIGEATADSPQQYGEVRTFSLPNSQLIVNYATKYFQPSTRNPVVLQPDVLIPYPWTDFAAGRDPALEYALRN